MRSLNFIITFLLFSIAMQFSAQAQQQDSVVLDNILTKTKKIAEQFPVEKVYVHFDKPYYSVADTIWFKAYVTMEQNLPSQLSKIVYLDVVNSRDSLVQTIKLPLADGVVAGNIPLTPGTYKQDNYYIRAYTVWMMNSGDQYFFNKTITVGEAIDKQINTHFSYKTTQTDKSQLIDAVVQYKNADNVVQANKVVNWKVISNYETVAKGKGTTDQNGMLRIKIDPKKNEIKNGELITDIVLSELTTVSSSFQIKPTASVNDFQMFPEGGELVSGLAMRIGFKSLSPNGLGIDLKGTVTDNEGNSLTTFNSTHLGMGSFYLTADPAKSYKVNVTFKDGSTRTFDVPKAKPSGIVTQINNTDAQAFNLKILSNDAFFAQNQGKTFFIVATHEGVIYYAAKTKLSTQVNSAKIPKDKFPAGIV